MPNSPTHLTIVFLLFHIPTSRHQQQPSFNCPNNGNPLVSSSGTNLFCTTLGVDQNCPASSYCVTSSNAAGVLICCSQPSNSSPTCPNNRLAQTTSTSQFQECSITNPTACQPGYQCVQSSNVASISLCCATSSNSACPSEFTPSLSSSGASISCDPSLSSTCPPMSSCMQSSQGSVFLCCRPSNSQRICTNNQNALITNGALELCTTPGTQCSSSGYTCQLSTLLSTYVCCGNGSIDIMIPQCLDGRPTYQQISGETFQCEISTNPSRCPSGYDCAASDDPFIDVCCLTGSPPIPDNLQCPSGWNPYRNEVDKAVRTCSAVLDTSCPIGYSCAPSNQPPLFLCCRFASSLVCINGKTLLVNGSPKMCSPTRLNQCPYNYSCEQSVNPTVTVCCSGLYQLNE